VTVRQRDIFAGVLVGGRGTRLGGADKARLRIGGTTLLESLVAKVSPRVTEVLLATRAGQGFPEVPCRAVTDVQAGRGPLAGLVALLEAGPRPWCWLLAVDLPRFDPDLLERLAAARGGFAAVVPEVGGRAQPTAALYHVSALPPLRAALARGEGSLQRALAAVPTARPVVGAPLDTSLFNLNGPEDLAVLGAS
jgi:molybdopterin-guanine dinucleotide biosynthesis protein A